jgi:hypothetical protein
MSVVNLDMYRNSHLIVEGESLSDGVIKWTITGEKQAVIDKSVYSLAEQTTSAAFSFPHKLPRDHPRYPWFQSIGYTSDKEDVARLRGLLRGDQPQCQ